MFETKQIELKNKDQCILSLDDKNQITATKRNSIFQDLQEVNRYIKIQFWLGKTEDFRAHIANFGDI